jgi:hypothetical protein
MSVTYTNRKGRTYFLCKRITKTGKPRYFFAREPKGETVEEIPIGYKISESVNGIVSLVKDRPSLIKPEEISSVKAEITQHPQGRRYKVSAKHDRIVIFEMVDPDAKELAGIFELSGFSTPGLEDRIQEHLEQNSQYTAVMQFILADPEQRTFRAQRWCYLGGIDDWIDIEYGTSEELSSRLIPLLGTDTFFDLY